jgi:hypothetical protein
LEAVGKQGVNRCYDSETGSSVLHMLPPPSSSLAPPLPPRCNPPVEPLVLVVLPLDRQGDLFGGYEVCVPAPELFGWSGGLAPRSVRRAVRREIARRDVSLSELAEAAGLSKRQMAHVLTGRLEASPAVAACLREFILQEAVTVKAAA